MQPLFLDDPAWQTTFPHRVGPLPDEWLTGLLLRCDEENGWESGTTFWLVTKACTKNDRQRWKRKMRKQTDWKRNVPCLITLSSVNISALTQYLGVEKRLCIATTYYAELARCYDLVNPPARLLYPRFTFRLCPACLAEARLIRRMFLLPCLRYCPRHQTTLLKICSCGTPLFPFNRHTPPFTCPSCHLDWAYLPLILAQASHMETEKKLLAHFTWLLTQGNPALLMNTFECISKRLTGKNEVTLVNEAQWQRSMNPYWILSKDTHLSLGALAIVLASLDIPPQEVLTQDTTLLQTLIEKQTFDLRSILVILMYAEQLDETSDGSSCFYW
jgi:hypothetical protein